MRCIESSSMWAELICNLKWYFRHGFRTRMFTKKLIQLLIQSVVFNPKRLCRHEKQGISRIWTRKKANKRSVSKVSNPSRFLGIWIIVRHPVNGNLRSSLYLIDEYAHIVVSTFQSQFSESILVHTSHQLNQSLCRSVLSVYGEFSTQTILCSIFSCNSPNSNFSK